MLLNFKILIRHSWAKNDQNLKSYIQASLGTTFNFILVKVISRFLVLTTSGSYKSNIIKILECTSYFSYMPIEKKSPI